MKSRSPARLDSRLWFPPPDQALRGGACDGLVAVGGDLSVPRLLLAYRSGIFPWTDDPVSWWAPDPRAIFEFDRFHVSSSLRRLLRKRPFEITLDRAFSLVIAGCAEPGPGREDTWITPAFVEAYTELHRHGHAHSVECWRGSHLVGGVYGLAIGGFFAAESMFHRESDASKVALHALIEHVRNRGFTLFDIQLLTPITRQLGAVTVPRAEYLRRLACAIQLPTAFHPVGAPMLSVER